MIGIVPGSEVETPASTVKIDVGPLREAALAPGRLAAAIGENVGGLFDDVSNQIQNARNTRKVFDADLQMRATKDQFLVDIQKNPQLAKDPGTWVPEYQQRVKQTQDAILNQSDLSPVAKRHLSMMSDAWALDSVSDVRTSALLRETADTKAAGISSANAALAAGDLNAGTAAYKALNEAGIMGPKETAQRIKEAPIVVAESKANVAISSNPIGAPKIIEEQLKKDLPPLKYRVIMGVAKENQKKAQMDNGQDLASRIDDSPDHTIDENLLKAWRDSGKIRPQDYEKTMNRIKSYAKGADAVRDKAEKDDFNVAMMEATPPTDATGIQAWAAEQKGKGLEWTNPAYRRRFNEFVDRKVDGVMKKGESEERPVERDIMDSMKTDPLGQGGKLIRSLTDTNSATYLDDQELKKRYGSKAERNQIVRQTQVEQARLFDKMREWFKDPANKDATEEQAEEYRQKLERPGVEAAVKDSLGVPGETPQPDISKADYDKLKSGDLFWYGGKQMNKQ